MEEYFNKISSSKKQEIREKQQELSNLEDLKSNLRDLKGKGAQIDCGTDSHTRHCNVTVYTDKLDNTVMKALGLDTVEHHDIETEDGKYKVFMRLTHHQGEIREQI